MDVEVDVAHGIIVRVMLIVQMGGRVFELAVVVVAKPVLVL